MRPNSRKLRFLLASGPTREPLDPVRYLSNYSTGVMGRCLADAIRRRGHQLTWVRSPEDAETANDLLARLRRELPRHDVLVMATAVCDVRPAKASALKIKKGGLKVIRLVENPDVLRELSGQKKLAQTFVGFALESTKVRANAIGKLKKKGLELILAQRVTFKKSPFGDTRLEATAYTAQGGELHFRQATKAQIAGKLIHAAEAIAALKLGNRIR